MESSCLGCLLPKTIAVNSNYDWMNKLAGAWLSGPPQDHDPWGKPKIAAIKKILNYDRDAKAWIRALDHGPKALPG
jgi:hypothetical protein